MFTQDSVIEIFKEVINNDNPVANKYPLMDSPKYLTIAVLLYLLMVIFGPQLMKNREPFKLRGVLIGYNFFTVLFSAYMFWEFFACSFLNPGFQFFCADVREPDASPTSIRMMTVVWLYFVSKIIEFVDTMFFVLRKKNQQISLLHVYHHTSMAILQWVVFKYIPVGAIYFGAMLNCFIHTLMYAYYMLSAFGPHMQKFLWWKKYLTSIQMVQFVMIISQICTCWKTCDFSKHYPHAFVALFIHTSYLLSLFWLFLRFYLKSYKAIAKKPYMNGKTD